MPTPARKRATYDDLYSLPLNLTGQIIEGELYALPRPHYRHSRSAAGLNIIIGSSYQFGDSGGPGGWIILIEPEIMFGENLLVPDLAGWKKERLPVPPEKNYTTIPPDWVCEILSPGTAALDRARKMPIYARHEIKHLWLVDPLAKTLEIYGLENGRWFLLGAFGDRDLVRAEPFSAVQIDLADLWWGD